MNEHNGCKSNGVMVAGVTVSLCALAYAILVVVAWIGGGR